MNTFHIFQYELGLPIEVKAGSIGKFNVNIPWNGLSSQPVVIKIEVPITIFINQYFYAFYNLK